MANSVNVFAGIPAINRTLYHRIRFSVGDPVAIIESDGQNTLILRDIEMERARQAERVHHVHCPAEFAPEQGLSGDRETATAQALAECLVRRGIGSVTVDRSLPMSFAHELEQRSVTLTYNPSLGVEERRAKDPQEVECLREAQRITARVMRRACEWVASAEADAKGHLLKDGVALTSERVQTKIDIWLLEENCSNPGSIVAGGPQGADCHHRGTGPLKTGQPIIIDIFPCHKATGYNGDCTRTVVHGDIPDEVSRMHQAVAAAKAAGIAATAAGTSGEAVHLATIHEIEAFGFESDRPTDSLPQNTPSMTHGTGHGLGLDVHEPPLLDFKGPELVVGDALTIEPGLYSTRVGGVRLEDLIVATETGCEHLNADLSEGLVWR